MTRREVGTVRKEKTARVKLKLAKRTNFLPIVGL